MNNREFLDNMIDYAYGKNEVDLEALYLMWKDDMHERINREEIFDCVTNKEISEGVIVG